MGVRLRSSHERPTSPFAIAADDGGDNSRVFAFSKPLSALLLIGLFVLVLLFYVYRAFSLQVVAGDQYRDLANGNRIREVVEYAQRGAIHDRDGDVLASSGAGYQVTVTPYLLPQEQPEKKRLYQRIARVVEGTWEDVQTTVEQEGLEYVLPIAVGGRLPQREALQFEADAAQHPAISVDVVPTREYEHVPGLSHILGYTSLVSESDMESDESLSLVDHVGRSGVEQQYDDVLRGVNGYKRYEVDAHGKPVRLLASKEATPGKDLHLTIDLDVQKQLAHNVAQQMQEAGVSKGSGVVMQPDTGAVLAMVSLPDYDNNLFARGITLQQYQRLINDEDEPLYNKVIAGAYPSGSIIKPLVASAALQEGVVTEDTIIHDRGYIDLVNRYNPSNSHRFYGWDHSGLGAMNVRRAIAMSSNIYFFTVGGGYGGIDGLGVDRLTSYYRQFGLGEPTGIDLPSEGEGRVPTPEWKEEQSGLPWTQGDTYNISIGQGDLLLSPLQITVAQSSIINGGKLLRPYVLHHVEGGKPMTPHVKRTIDVDSAHFQAVREGMHEVTVNGATNPARFAGVPVKFGGKSGTAETSADGERPDHGWFTAFAPYENPELMMSVLIEHGVSGSTSAAPAVAGFLENYYEE